MLKPALVASGSRQATAGETSNQPRNGFSQALQKFKKNVTKRVSNRFKRSHHQTTAVQSADHLDASSSQNIEDTLPLHPSDADKPATSENPSGYVNQGAPGESASKDQAASSGVGEGPDSKLVDAGLRGAREGMEDIGSLGKHVKSVASAANDGPKDLDTVDNYPDHISSTTKNFQQCH